VPRTRAQPPLAGLAEVAELMSDGDSRHGLATGTDAAVVHRLLTSTKPQE